MNFHITVIVCTVLFYIILKMYFNKNDTKKDKRQGSRLIYVLIVPISMYLYQYISNKSSVYNNNIDNITDNLKSNISDNMKSSTHLKSESLLTSLFPESSVNISSTSS